MTKETLYKAWSIEDRLRTYNEVLNILTNNEGRSPLVSAVSYLQGNPFQENDDMKFLTNKIIEAVKERIEVANKELEAL